MYESIDSYPREATKDKKVGQCHICGEGIFSDEKIWQSEKGDLYYCNKCVEESSIKRFRRQEETLDEQEKLEFIEVEVT